MRRSAFGTGRQTALPILFSIAAIALVAACSGSLSPILSTVGGPVGSGTDQRAVAPQASPGSGAGEAIGDASVAGAAAKDDALIVRTGHLGLQVADVDAALARAQASIEALGGYIGASSRSTTDDRPIATVTYRVPVDRWDAGLSALRGTATKVLSEQTDAMEVTGQAVDLDARIRNLRATETALQGVLAKAQKIPDILEVENQLSSVRGQIEQLVAQRTELGDRAALGTIEVAFGTEVVAVTAATRSWDPAGEVDEATAALVDILQALASAAIWLGIVWLPVLAVLGVVVLLVAFAVRRARRRGRRGAPPSTPSESIAAGTAA